MNTNRTANLHMRVDSQFKADIEAAAARLDIPPSAFMRMAIREYLAAHEAATLREHSATGYSAPPPPPIKARRAAISQAIPTAFYAVARPKSAS